MKPMYLMASTPAGFTYGEDDFASTQNDWLACCAPSQQFLLDAPGAKSAAEAAAELAKKRRRMGPPPPDDGSEWVPQGDDREATMLNRVLRWTEEGITMEADPRQVEKLLHEMRLDGANSLSAPGLPLRGIPFSEPCLILWEHISHNFVILFSYDFHNFWKYVFSLSSIPK